MAKPLTERIYAVGNKLIIEDCNGNTKEIELDCGCSDSGGDTVPEPPIESGDACDKYVLYANGIVDILEELSNQFSIQPHNNFGHDVAIGATAYNKGLPLSPWVTSTRWYFRTEAGSANYDAFMAVSAMFKFEDIVCAVQETFEIGYGVFDYENFITRMTAKDMQEFATVISFIPIARFKELIYLLGTGQPPLTNPSLTSDCECGEGTSEPANCDSPCEVTACHKLIPNPMSANEFTVTGYTRIVVHAPPNDANWVGADYAPLRIDMLVNRCVKKVQMISYTPCGLGGGTRSAHYRVEIDDVAVTDFKCSIFGSAKYLPCGDLGGFNGAGVIEFVFPEPILGRRINIVPMKPELILTQVNVITCVD